MSEGQYILNLINKYLYQSESLIFKNKKNYEEFFISPKLQRKLFEPKFLYFKKFYLHLTLIKKIYIYIMDVQEKLYIVYQVKNG